MFVYRSDGSFRLVLSYDGVGFHYNHLSSLMGEHENVVVGASSCVVLRAEALAGEGPRLSVLSGVLCAMEPSAQQCELLHHFLHSALVHSLSARQENMHIFYNVRGRNMHYRH